MPWYRSSMLWFALALPAATVAAGIVTYRVAAQDSSEVAPDSVRRVAQVQTANLDADEAAARLGLAATLVFDVTTGRIDVHLADRAAETGLMLRLTHATQARHDRALALVRQHDGDWTASALGIDRGVYTVSLSPANGAWRLVGTLRPDTRSLALRPLLGNIDG